MYVVVSYLKNGTELLSKPLSWASAYTLWERKNSRSKRRFGIRKAE